MADDLTMELDSAGSIAQQEQAAPHSDRVAFVGQLAGAIGNQFNNLMMAVTGFAELELKKATPAQKRRLEQILAHSALATALVQKLLAFTKTSSTAPCNFALNPVIEDLSRILRPLLGEEIAIHVRLDRNVGYTFADPSEVERLVLGLALHARDGMGQGGQVELSTELVELDSSSFGRGEVPKTGPYVLLTVRYASASGSNSGRPAIPASRVEVAIAAARAIVREQGGLLRASIRPGVGTTFQIHFPATSGEAMRTQAHAAQSTGGASTKTILIVEDDDGVRDPAAEFLKMEGFKVLQARTGREALRIVQDSRSKVDLLATDIVMAGMPGTDVAAELVKANPDLKVLYMSGDPERVAELGKQMSTHPMLQKPFRLNVLSDKIRELVGE